MGRYPDAERLVTEVMGLDIESIGLRVFERAVGTVLGPDVSPADCLMRLEPGTPELDELIDLLVVPETWFFRDRGAFEYLQRYVQQRAQTPAGRQVFRALSAPSSTGEEAFSIAATLLKAELAPTHFSIEGLDISGKAVATAQQATYRAGSFREKRAEFPPDFLQQAGELQRVSPEIVARVRFLRANLMDGSWPVAGRLYDAIFCKNLLIYLTTEGRNRLVRTLGGLLREDGVLFVGHSEVTLFQRAGYRAVGYPRSFAVTPAPKESLSGIAPPKPIKPRPVRTRKADLPAAPILMKGDRTTPVRTAPAMSAGKTPGIKDESSSLARARKLADRGELEQAASVCDSLLTAHCMDPEVYYLAGLIRQASDRADEAEGFFLKAIYLDPKHYETLVQLCLLSERKGDSSLSKQYRDRMRRLQARQVGRKAEEKANA